MARILVSIRASRKQAKVQPAWVYRADGVVWRAVPTDAGVFVGEDRNPETRQVSFFCVNRTTGEVLWEGISLDEQWWIGIEAVHRDRILLHGYSRPDMPDHQRILALDLFTGRCMWTNDDMRYILAAEDSLFASKDTLSGRTIFELSLRTGSVLRSLEDDPEALRMARSHMQAQGREEPEFPLRLGGYYGIDESAVVVVHKHCQSDDLVGLPEVIDRDNLVFFSYYEKGDTDGRLRNVLKVVDQNVGELVFAETLGQHLLNTVPDSFFLQGNMLYFVKDRSSLTAVNIDDLKR